MKKKIWGALLAATILFFLFIFPAPSSAQQCSGQGSITFGVGPTQLDPGQSVTFNYSFRWKAGTHLSCFNEDVVIDIILDEKVEQRANGTYRPPDNLQSNVVSTNLGKIGLANPNEVKQGIYMLSHSGASSLGNGSVGAAGGSKQLKFSATARQNQSAIFIPDIYTKSAQVTVNYTASLTQIFACIAANGTYACSPGNVSDCSDVPNNACAGRQCSVLSDSRLCGTQANVQPPPPPTGGVPPGPAPSPGTGPAPSPSSFGITIPNPLCSQGSQQCGIAHVIDRILTFLLQVAVPISVLVILWAGFLFMTAGASEEKRKKAKGALFSAVVGIAILMLATGIVKVIISILN